MRNLILALRKVFYEANVRHTYKENNKFLWLVCNVSFRMMDMFLITYLHLYQLFRLYPTPLVQQNDIVVSLTSFPKRIGKVWMVVDSMFHQQLPPGKVLLYLSKEEFPNGRKDLPKRLLGYERLGLEICFHNDNIMPHKKYFYALQEHKNKFVITIDDDIYYRNDLILSLWNLHLQHPNSICANTINIIQFDEKHNFTPYKEWIRPYVPTDPSLLNIAIGFNGVLYPPHIFHSNEIFNINNIKLLALKADDLWLKAHEVLQKIPVVCGEYYSYGSLIGNQNVALFHSNADENRNDVQWEKLCQHYQINKNSFMVSDTECDRINEYKPMIL